MNTVNIYLSDTGGSITEMFTSQSFTPAYPIPGITILSANGNPLGSHDLSYNKTTGILSWIGVEVKLLSDGIYKLGGNANLVFSLSGATLPNFNITTAIIIDKKNDNMLRTITHQERLSGITIYRCGYIYNSFDTDLNNVIINKENTINFGDIEFATEYQDLTFDSLSAIDVEKLLVVNSVGKILIESGFKVRTDITNYYKNGEKFVGARHEKIPNTQNSDGNIIDVATKIESEYDYNNIISNLQWNESLTFNTIKSKRYASFWLKYNLPVGSTGVEKDEYLDLKLNYKK